MINSYTTNGLFNAHNVSLEPIVGDGAECELEARISGSRDVFVLINIPANANGTHKLICKSAMGYADKEITLNNAKLNLVRITTNGIADGEGIGHFKFTTTHSGGINGLNASICFVKYTPVVNN